jgi:Flp pilus assembly protein TadG
MKNQHTRRSSWQGESGAVIVEFALILPFLTLLFVGAIDVGLVTMDHQILQNAAREGARYAAMDFNDLDDPGDGAAALVRIQDRVVHYLADEGITVLATDVSVEQSSPDCVITYADGTSVGCSRVIVNYDKPLFLPGLNLLGLDPVPLEGRAVFRNLFGN